MQYHIAFSSDINYLPYLLVAVQSIVDHLEVNETETTDEVVFHFLVDQTVEPQELEKKTQAFCERNQHCPVKLTFILHQIKKEEFASFSPWHTFNGNKASSRGTYYRFLLAEILDPSIAKVLYLDIDILVLADIRKIFSYTLEGKILGAVKDLGIISAKTSIADNLQAKDTPQNRLVLSQGEYFNAGILLINMQEWRRQEIGTRCMELAGQYNARYHDQDLLNFITKGKVEFLDLRWNFITSNFLLQYDKHYDKFLHIGNVDPHRVENLPEKEVFEEAKEHPCLIHFIYEKPWHLLNIAKIGQRDLEREELKAYPYLEQWMQTYLATKEAITPAEEMKVQAYLLVYKSFAELYQRQEHLKKKRRQDRKLLLTISIALFSINFLLFIIAILL